MRKGMLIGGIVLLVLLIAALLAATYCGAFRSVTVATEEFGPVWLVYEKHKGDYRGIRGAIEDVRERLVRDDSIRASVGFGLYYDKPGDVATEELRSIGGVIIEHADEETLARVLAHHPAAELPRTQALVVHWPMKGGLSMLIAMAKVYPKLARYMEENNIAPVPSMEIYDTGEGEMTFVVPYEVDARVFDYLLSQGERPE